MFAGCFQGIVGFGQGLIATPLSLTFLHKGTVLTAMAVAGLVLNSTLTRKVKEPLDKKIFWPLLIGAATGMPFGLMLLKILPTDTLKVIAGTLSIIFTVALLFVKATVHHTKKLAPAVGLISGMLQASTGMPGPPIVLLLTSGHVPRNVMRKVLFSFFVCSSMVALLLFFANKVLTLQGLLFGIAAAPFVIVGGHYGNKLADFIPHRWYRILALGTVSLTGLFAIYSGLSGG